MPDNMEEEENDQDEKMSEEEKGKSDLQEFRQKIMNVLTSLQLDTTRPIKMKQEDFIKLLWGFNEAGIHFK